MSFRLELFNLSPFHNGHQGHPNMTHNPTLSETGLRNITAPTQVRRMDDVLNDPSCSAHNFQRSNRLEAVKTYRLMPIFSGVMITFAIMLSIPSLTDNWYIRTYNNVIIEIQPNPRLLNVALGFSMAFAVLASASLVVRFAERCVKQMTLASIAFLTLHDLINIPVVTVFGVIHRFDDGFTYGQSFWFTVCATIVSTSANITLITDYTTTQSFAKSGSGLTSKQRSLVIVAMVLLSYLSLGSLIESKLLGIPFLDALYFSVVTLETIGFGDIYPNSTYARVFTCIYIVGGILNIALAVTIAREVILESAAIEFQKRLAAQKHNRRLRSRWRAAVCWRLRERGLPSWIYHHRHGHLEEQPHHERWYDWLSRTLEPFLSRRREDPAWKFQYGPRQKCLNIEALTDADWTAAALETGAPLSKLVPEELRARRQDSMHRPPGNPLPNRPTIDHAHWNPAPPSLTHARLGGMLAILGNFAWAVSRLPTQDFTDSHHFAIPRRDLPNTTADEKGYEASNQPRKAPHCGVPPTMSMTILEDDRQTEANLEIEAKQIFATMLLLAFSLFFVFWVAGSAIFMKTEKWSFWTAAYFCFVSFTTLGYGDLAPKTPAGMSIFVVWALLGVGTMTILISVIMEAFSQRYLDVIRSEVSWPTPNRRPTLSEYPTFTSGTDDEFFSPNSPYFQRGIRKDTIFREKSRSRIRIQESIPNIRGPVKSTPKGLQAMNDSQSVPMQVDHLKSLITMARAQSESSVSYHLENLISYLEKTLHDLESSPNGPG